MRLPSLLRLGLIMVAALGAGQDLGAYCGKERRDIKSGFENAALSINTSTPRPVTIDEMNTWPAPNPIPASTRVGPPQPTSWAIEGILQDYKLEGGSTGDRDYHLVIRDDHNHSIIAEIPDPDCVGEQASPFQTAIAKARADFDARYNATGSFHTAGVPGRFTGIGMFDFPHGQRGYALNGIEIHPVLSIEFNPSGPTPQPSPGGTVTQLVGNEGLEAGEGSLTPWLATYGVVTDDSSVPAHSGDWKAWLGGYVYTHSDHLYQQMRIPPQP